jgi:hypothetical protein
MMMEKILVFLNFLITFSFQLPTLKIFVYISLFIIFSIFSVICYTRYLKEFYFI